MCGIAGIIHFKETPVNREQLVRMNSFIASRGPDGEGYWIHQSVGLAHRRLSIIDLSDKAAQPMVDVSDRVVITYNGEIYNYQELKKELLQKQVVFFSESDTEVLLNGYLTWGINGLLNKIEGMFAFVLYDKINRTAYACRDRLGKKPLYYCYKNDQFVFSSDIRSIQAVVSDLSMDYEALDYYFTELSMPQPNTIWKEIKQVKPAHYIAIELNRKNIQETSYWNFHFDEKLQLSEQEALEQTEKYLTKAILKRTVGDVPIACFLSGGADSGLITALLASHSSSRVNTYSVGFGYDDYNELPQAKKLAERYNTHHTEIIVESNIQEDLQNIVLKAGEPFADSSIVPSYYIAQEIGKVAKVAISGDGGDETYGGYADYSKAFQTEQHFKNNPHKLIRQAKRLINFANYRMGITNKNYGFYEHYHELSPSMKLYRHMGFDFDEKNKLYSFSLLKESSRYTSAYLTDVWNVSKHPSITDTLFETSFKTRLLNDYLVKVDRSSMMNSLEVRSPFLDHQLVEFSSKLPNEIKLKQGIEKYLLKKLAQKYIDKDFFSRKKMGFGIPLKYWLRKELKAMVNDLLFSDSFKNRQLFNIEYVEKIVDEHQKNKNDHTHKIWALVCLELWFKGNSYK